MTQQQGNILVVYGSQETLQALATVLQDKPYRATLATEASEALQAVRAQLFQLVLLDLGDRQGSGSADRIALLRQLKELAPQTPLMVMAWRDLDKELTAKAIQAGADSVLYKPFETEAVAAILTGESLSLVRPAGADEGPPPQPSPAETKRPDGQIDLRLYQVQPEAIRLVPEGIARKYNLLPLSVEGSTLMVAMAEPQDLLALEDLWVLTRKQVKALPAALSDIQTALGLHYRSTGKIEQEILRLAPEGDAGQQREELRQSSIMVDTPIVRTVDLLITQAVKDGVSDIHIEPQETHLRVRYRLDGILHDTMSLPMSVQPALLSRIKIMADMNIAERRRFQDGTFAVTVDGQTVDIRTATANTTWGEMAVLRILDKSLSVLDLSDLGFLPNALEAYRRMLRAPFGMILVSGPTGSGKTTTLYASLNQMDRKSLNVMTVEDPVEYHFSDINQIQVNRLADVTFAKGLRAIMRLDPDVVLVGEIRDSETAETAVQAALTGHLVLSSVHANDAVGVLYRLLDLGVPPFLLNSAVIAIVAQRLVRGIHKNCLTQKPASLEGQRAYEQELGEKRELFDYGAGCPFCSYIGYKGRTGVYETLVMSEEIRRLFAADAGADQIKAQAIKEGMVTMAHAGMLKVKQGVTTPEEVLRNVFTIV